MLYKKSGSVESNMNSNFNVNKYITCLILILFVSFAWKESFSDSTLELLNFLKIFGHQAEISISYLKKEIEKNPDNPNLKLVLGSLYLELFLEKESKLDVTLLNKAEEEFKEVIKLKNDESYAYFYLGNIAMLNKANKGKAIEFYKKAILYNKNSWGAYSLLNFVLVGEKRFDEIIKILEDAKKEIKITEDNRDKASSVFHNLALNYLMISDYTNALINATEATKLFPTKEHLHLLGICYFQKKDFQKAIDRKSVV